MQAYIDLRPYITLRRSTSNEKGLFFSLPSIILYDFTTEIDDKIDLLIEGFHQLGDTQPVLFQTTFIVQSHCFLHNGNFTTKVLLSSISNIRETNYGQPIKLALYIELNKSTGMLDFYDAYYHVGAPIPHDFFDDTSVVWEPFILGSIRGNKFPPNITEPPVPANQYFWLEVDPLTNVINHCIMSDDHLFSRRTSYGLENTDELAGRIPFADQLVDHAMIDVKKNSINITTIDTDNTSYQELQDIKNKIQNFRDIQRDFSSKEYRINQLTNAETFDAFKSSISESRSAIHDLTFKIELDQYAIARKRMDAHRNKLKSHDEAHNWTYYSALCLLTKDENEYIKEWLDSWDALGIDHFYIYDNASKVPIKDTIAAIDDGKYLDKCTIVDWSTGFIHMQYDCYEHCLTNYGAECYWIGFVDTDEILEFTTPELKNINDFLSQYENYFGLWIPWECYNANGLVNKPTGLQRENYTKVILNPLGLYGKVFIQPHRCRKMYVHLGVGLDEFDIVVNQNFTPHIPTISTVRDQYYSDNRGCFTKAKINHYITRSFEDWVNKMNRGSCDPNFRRKFDVFFDYNPDLTYLKNDPKVQELLCSQQGYIRG